MKKSIKYNKLLFKFKKIMKNYSGSSDVVHEVMLREIERELPERINLEKEGLVWIELKKNGPEFRRTYKGIINPFRASYRCDDNNLIGLFSER